MTRYFFAFKLIPKQFVEFSLLNIWKISWKLSETIMKQWIKRNHFPQLFPKNTSKYLRHFLWKILKLFYYIYEVLLKKFSKFLMFFHYTRQWVYIKKNNLKKTDLKMTKLVGKAKVSSFKWVKKISLKTKFDYLLPFLIYSQFPLTFQNLFCNYVIWNFFKNTF